MACPIFVPSGAAVEAQAIAVDVRVIGLSGRLTLRRVAGDVASAGRGGASSACGGDVALDRLVGDLHVERVGGCRARPHPGEVQPDAVWGGLSLSAVGDAAKVRVGADAAVELTPPPHTACTIETRGDLSCSLPEGVALEAHVAGAREDDGQGIQIRMEGSLAAAELFAGGELWEGKTRWSIRARIPAEIDVALAQAVAGPADSGGFCGLEVEWFRDCADRAGERARGKPERMQQRSDWTRAR